VSSAPNLRVAGATTFDGGWKNCKPSIGRDRRTRGYQRASTTMRLKDRVIGKTILTAKIAKKDREGRKKTFTTEDTREQRSRCVKVIGCFGSRSDRLIIAGCQQGENFCAGRNSRFEPVMMLV
jgi:hypothetical protein